MLRRHWWCKDAALIAALFLCLQMIFTSLTMTIAAADPLGNSPLSQSLCITGTQGSDENGPAEGGAPDCCTSGCTAHTTLTNVLDARAALDNPLSHRTAGFASAAAVPQKPASKHAPGRPRAPPYAI
jgi:hypothetical protein